MNDNEKKIVHFICYFVTIATFIYVFSDLVGLNMPRYYPLLREWSIAPIKDAASMGYYSKLGITFVLSLILAFAYKLFHRKKEENTEILIGFMSGTVVFGILFFVAEEWHKWGIEKMKLDSTNFFNYEFWFFIFIIILFISALCLSTKGKKQG